MKTFTKFSPKDAHFALDQKRQVMLSSSINFSCNDVAFAIVAVVETNGA